MILRSKTLKRSATDGAVGGGYPDESIPARRAETVNPGPPFLRVFGEEGLAYGTPWRVDDVQQWRDNFHVRCSEQVHLFAALNDLISGTPSLYWIPAFAGMTENGKIAFLEIHHPLDCLTNAS